ncbi:glutaminase A [Bradyrhizobium sp. LM2.7]
MLRFLDTCLNEFSAETSGAVADYIPELGKADPAYFGISLATLDGHVYEVGDSRVPFTIQSMSKPFVFALALDLLGAGKVESAIGVEPSGDPFNSIRLNSENHPFNPMVNAGAIACTGLIQASKGADAFEQIRLALGRFAGRDLAVDEAVYASESQTGDRNRAIAYLLKTNAVISDNVADVLDVYFRQCAVLVTARDIAVMAATLANRGVNPVTCEQVLTPYAISRTLSVMTSSGMYDYAGEWIYRIGIPAKSGVGGGILAALPARLGLGSYSPRLDKHGNSVRGIKVCEALSSHYDLHMLNRSDDARNAVIADYDIGKSPSRRVRRPQEREILAAHQLDVRVIELVGTLSLSAVDYVSRRLAGRPRPQFVVFDLHRVTSTTRAGARLVAEAFQGARSAERHRDHLRRQARLEGVEHAAGMDRRAEERSRLLPARHRDRMGGRPDRLPLWRLDRLSRDHRACRAAVTCGAWRQRAGGPGLALHHPHLSIRRQDRGGLRSRRFPVLPAQRRRACHAARRRAAGDTDCRHGLRRNGPAGSHPLRRCFRRHGSDRIRSASQCLRALPQAAPTCQRAHHAQFGAAPGRSPDRRQHQGGYSDLDVSWPVPSPLPQGEVGSHRRCDPGEGLRSHRVLRPLTRIAAQSDLSPTER